MKKTQTQRVAGILKARGRIGRNYCLRTLYITRLAARIADLKEAGWEIAGKREKGDYVYRLTGFPKETV